MSASEDLTVRLKDHLIEHHPPAGDPFFSVRERALEQWADERGASLTRAMMDCLNQGIWPERFRAHRGSFTAQDQIRLLGSTVAVIGAGGLGGTVVMLLARAGVGRLIVADGDVFDESNLNRQWLSNLDRVGQNKARVAAEVIGRINPGAVITPYPAWATDQNLPEILAPAQVAVDCLDTLAARYLLEQAAKARGIPYIHAAVAGFEGVLMTVFPEDPGLAGLYGPDPAPKSMSAESFLGVPTAAPAILGGYQALETIHVLLGRRLMAKRRMVHFDLALAQVETCDLG